jgi:alkylhydroperoxidase family enzyme
MFLLNTVAESEAQGKIKEGYDMFPGPVPAPLILLSASPELFDRQIGYFHYYRGHKSLSFPLLTAIRFISSDECGHDFCLDFNRQILLRAGMSASEVDAMKEDPSTAPLEDKEQAMLAFVAKALRSPKAVTQMDVDGLRSQGWTDADILDAMLHGANMKASAAVFNALSR